MKLKICKIEEKLVCRQDGIGFGWVVDNDWDTDCEVFCSNIEKPTSRQA